MTHGRWAVLLVISRVIDTGIIWPDRLFWGIPPLDSDWMAGLGSHDGRERFSVAAASISKTKSTIRR